MKKIKACELKIGDLIVPDPDCFMLGDRWRVVSIGKNDEVYCDLWSSGCRSIWAKSDWIIPLDSLTEIWIDEGETIDSWSKACAERRRKREQLLQVDSVDRAS